MTMALAAANMAFAQEENPWVGEALPAEGGEFYLYNKSGDGFLLGANTWGTQGSLGQPGLLCTVVVSNGKYKIVTRCNGDNRGLGSDGYIDNVQSIEREINIVRVPNAMKYISGIVNLRGEVIPAFSLRKKFGTDDNVGVIGEDSTVIVNIPGVVKLALEVDEVLEIGDIDAQSIVQMPALAKTVDTEYLDRVANVNGQLVILLDVEKLLTQSEAESVKKFTEDMNDNDGGAANV